MYEDIIKTSQELSQQREDESKKLQEEDKLLTQTDLINKTNVEVAKQLVKFMHEYLTSVEVKNMPTDLAKSQDMQKMLSSLEKLINVQSSNTGNLAKSLNDGISGLIESIQELKDETSDNSDEEEYYQQICADLQAVRQAVIDANKAVLTNDKTKDVISSLKTLEKAVKGLKLAPSISVSPTPIDLSGIEKAIAEIPSKIEIPQTVIPENDNTELMLAINATTEAIKNIIFPVAEFPTTVKVVNPDGTNVASNSVSPQTDVFNQQIIGTRNNQLEVDFSGTDPDSISTLTVTKTNGGDASTSGGQAVFETSTNTSGEIKAITTRTVTYHPHSENYAAFTAIFTTGVANSYQRIGLYDDNNGFFIGFEGTSFGVTKRSGGVDTRIAQASFSADKLDGSTGSNYTRNGVAEALDPTKDNLYRIRYGWLGAAPISYEVLSPDGEWVTFHVIKHPNTAAVPTIQEPNQPLRVHIKKTTAGTTNLTIKTACWAAGASTDLQKITSTLYDETLAKTVRSVITGVTTGGGGGYVNVKVNPSGALTTDSTISGNVSTESAVYYKRLDDTTTTNMIYIGEATPGTATSSATWRIKRLNVASGLVMQWAGSGSFNQVWDNRAGLSYT